MSELAKRYRISRAYADASSRSSVDFEAALAAAEAWFGRSAVAAFDRPLARISLRAWRDQQSGGLTAANLRLEAMSRLLTFAVETGSIVTNPCLGIPLLDEDPACAIWADADLDALAAHASLEVMDAIRLAAHTGLRRPALLQLRWDQVSSSGLSVRVGRNRRPRVVPLYPALRALLERRPRRGPMVLTDNRGLAWGPSFNTAYARSKQRAGVALDIGALQGTAAARMRLAGVPALAVMSLFDWPEARVERALAAWRRQAAARKTSSAAPPGA